MGLARTAGRKGRPWRRLRAQVLAESDVCIWCGHHGSQDVNHDIPISVAPELRMTRSNLSPIHGSRGGCPVCVTGTGRTRKCNNEVGRKVLITSPMTASRSW